MRRVVKVRIRLYKNVVLLGVDVVKAVRDAQATRERANDLDLVLGQSVDKDAWAWGARVSFAHINDLGITMNPTPRFVKVIQASVTNSEVR